MKSAEAVSAYEDFKALVAEEHGDKEKIKDGIFGAMMDVELVNDGPVTLVVDSPQGSPKAEAAAPT
jgi:D-tyrosyl-tRNA(Tyr) deacylase